MAKKLNRDKPYGEIFGGGREKFEQDGCYFDVHGELVAEAPEAPVEEGRKKGRGKDQAKDEQSSLLDDQLAAQAEVAG